MENRIKLTNTPFTGFTPNLTYPLYVESEWGLSVKGVKPVHGVIFYEITEKLGMQYYLNQIKLTRRANISLKHYS